MGRMFWLIAALVGGVALAWHGTVTPKPLPAAAPADVFSAERAMADIAIVGKVPHPIGSPANQAVRDYLVGRMTAMGLSPRVQTTQALRQDSFKGEAWVIGGTVQNIVGIMPGRNPRLPLVVLMAHYDSVPGSPGAADDASGVAAVLEAVRAIKARGPADRGLIVLLTDAEELNLDGARAFFSEHPLRDRVGAVVNLEARGGGGRALMFETGPGNAQTVDLYARAARRAEGAWSMSVSYTSPCTVSE